MQPQANSDREELTALRRLGELEAKVGNGAAPDNSWWKNDQVVTPAAPPPAQPVNTQTNRYDSMSDAELMSAYQKSKSPAPLSGGKKTYSIEEVMGNAAPAQPAAPEQSSERKNRSLSDESTYRKALLEQWGVAAMFLFGGLIVGWGTVAAIGWIVRGFMGIPRGQDMRPTP